MAKTTARALIPKNLGEGNAAAGNGNVLLGLLLQIYADLQEVKAKFDGHKHRVDNSGAGAATDITGLPVTGTTTGTPTGGTLSTVTIGLKTS